MDAIGSRPLERGWGRHSADHEARSWVDYLLAWVDRLPISPWVFYPMVFLAGHALVIAARLQGGMDVQAALRSPPPVFLLWVVALLAMTHYLNRLAVSRLRVFRPALQVDDAEFEAIAWQLSHMPARPALLNSLVWLAIAVVIVGLSWDSLIALGYPRWEIVLTTMTYFLGGAITYHSIHQLRYVRSLYARVREVDLYHLDPLHALPGLTARTSLGWILLLYVTSLLLPEEIIKSAFGATWLVAIGVAIAAFAAPLLGMHGRLEAAKRRALDENGDRLVRVVGEFHERLDRGDLEEADRFHKASQSLLSEHERLTRLSTWPWSNSTLRGFVTALLLPVVLRVGQELLSRAVLGGQ